MECWQVFTHGLKRYSQSFYNIMDTFSLGLYLASYALRIIVDYKINASNASYSKEINIAKNMIYNSTQFDEYFEYRNNLLKLDDTYWLRGCKQLFYIISTSFKICKYYLIFETVSLISMFIRSYAMLH